MTAIKKLMRRNIQRRLLLASGPRPKEQRPVTRDSRLATRSAHRQERWKVDDAEAVHDLIATCGGLVIPLEVEVTADGIPGLPGWGAKSAATVLAAPP